MILECHAKERARAVHLACQVVNNKRYAKSGHVVLNLFLLAMYGLTASSVIAANEPACSSPLSGAPVTAYYVSSSGNDEHEGNRSHPWKTIQRLNEAQLKEGDSIFFKGGETFTGTLLVDPGESGTRENPIVFTSSGGSNAIIDARSGAGLIVNKAGYIRFDHLNFKGAGRKDGNTKDGVVLHKSHHIRVDGMDIKGFQKAGLLIYSSSNILAENVYAHENGFAGISILGETSKDDCRDIMVSRCIAENNPGDPTNFENHSGNGIIAGFCKKVIIDQCAATNNGWDMPRIGNGPVGIWCFEADSVIIQRCISYRNKTAAGAADGGGYDLDGGVTNSIIQYCLSYENQGSAFGIFQYEGASNWYNNIIRFNISENDGGISPAHAAVFVWNSSRDTNQLRDLFFYNNTIYNERGAAISYERESEHAGFHFYNNIFVAKDTLITGNESTGSFLGNDWWSLSGNFVMNGIKRLPAWASLKGKEQLKNKVVGLNKNPLFQNPGKTALTDPSGLQSFETYRLPPGSSLRKKGVDLLRLFGIDPGSRDFNERPMQQKGIGACF